MRRSARSTSATGAPSAGTPASDDVGGGAPRRQRRAGTVHVDQGVGQLLRTDVAGALPVAGGKDGDALEPVEGPGACGGERARVRPGTCRRDRRRGRRARRRRRRSGCGRDRRDGRPRPWPPPAPVPRPRPRAAVATRSASCRPALSGSPRRSRRSRTSRSQDQRGWMTSCRQSTTRRVRWEPSVRDGRRIRGVVPVAAAELAPVDDQALPRDPRCVVGCEEQHGHRLVAGCPRPPERDARRYSRWSRASSGSAHRRAGHPPG